MKIPFARIVVALADPFVAALLLSGPGVAPGQPGGRGLDALAERAAQAEAENYNKVLETWRRTYSQPRK